MLSDEELGNIQEALGRHPTVTELTMLEAQWSEQASFKSTRRWFHLLKTEGNRVVIGIGEGAGVVDLGDEVLLGVTMRAYNQPTADDVYESSAGGVGRVIGNVLSQGCRPVALLTSIRVGDPQDLQNATSLDRIVEGVSDYGNSVGVPMVAGETEFHDSYSGNYILNMVCIGESSPGKVIHSIAKTPGDALVLFGVKVLRSIMKKGRKGGYCVAQRDLIEALEIISEKHLVAGLQDIGAGGLLSAAAEMAQRGGTGVTIDVDNIPGELETATAAEKMLDETTERLLAAVAPRNLDRFLDVLKAHGAPFNIVGTVTYDPVFVVREKGQTKAELPISLLLRGFEEPALLEEDLTEQISSHEWTTEPGNPAETIMRILGSLNICDRSWIYSQFDQHAQMNTVVDIGENAGVIEFPKGKLVAVATDCNSIWTSLDPYSGAANSACEALRNVVSVGGMPILLADCLNFGNPERPESYGQLVESIRGIGQFSRDFDIPVVAGSVSLYNEKMLDGDVLRINPTPQVMVAGLMPKGQTPVMRGLCTPLANIYLIGDTHRELNGTEYQLIQLGKARGLPPAYRPNFERNAMEAILEARLKGIIRSCNNIGRGGLAVAIMKMALSSNYGFRVDIDKVPGTAQTETGILFSETTGRYLAEVTETNQDEFVSIMANHRVSAVELGLTTFEQMANFGSFKIEMEAARETYTKTLANRMRNISK